MTSTYGYITLAELEAFCVKDFSAIDSALSDTVVDAQITAAEEFMIGYIGYTFTGTIPAAIKLCCKKIAKINLQNYMTSEKIGTYAANEGVEEQILDKLDIVQVLEQYKDQYNPRQGMFISKRVHVAPTSYREMKRPTGW